MAIRLINDDCFSAMKELGRESIDLIITSPPYCMKKAYESPEDDVATFRQCHEEIFSDIYRVLKIGGSVCWQIGYHVSEACVVPLDFIVYDTFIRKSKKRKIPFVLRNRIIWTFGHGLNSTRRFSGRHETILWFTKGESDIFNLDVIRVPQKYPGKRAYKGAHKGELTGNPLGKNPSDVWDIPNVKANHVEKTKHPCQFPVAIPTRLILALTRPNAVVLDPFMGSGSTGVAAVLENRSFVGIEKDPEYFRIAKTRLDDAEKGTVKVRPDVPVRAVDKRMSVAKLPKEFQRKRAAFKRATQA